MAIKTTIDGNEAAAYAAYNTNEVIAIYPITPSSPMGEFSDEWAAVGKTKHMGNRATGNRNAKRRRSRRGCSRRIAGRRFNDNIYRISGIIAHDPEYV